ncbi:hypothetical protein BN59_02603 [Legionella massiliensis]|uniref:Uncharacterized protein n=1 Tax=Legionella massiliensis TaxID=1034943 RepID=A0A078L2P6_9GAMM|nr:hypothetical protein [Legionella massiliensis]CDZ78293.1 hypothetical protein BN59_02603 [Legionella massiliensis]CEE14031.1 hypothetical protein BN1094_02603 [Legionella massiliensis]
MKYKTPKDVEDALNLLIENLKNYPSTTKEQLFLRMNAIITLLNSIETNDLLSCMFRAKVLEWVLQESLLFKHNYANDDFEINNIVIAVTESLLTNLKACLLLNFGLKALPSNLPQPVLSDLKTSEALDKVLDAKYKEYFNFYVTKTHETDMRSKMNRMDFFYSSAKKQIEARITTDSEAPKTSELGVSGKL